MLPKLAMNLDSSNYNSGFLVSGTIVSRFYEGGYPKLIILQVQRMDLEKGKSHLDPVLLT